METRQTLLTDLEEAIMRGNSDRRVTTLRKVTDLFLMDPPALSDEQVSVFDDVILRLSSTIESRARIELSERLAPVDNSPIQTVRNLAHDENIEVAGPVLSNSTRLEDSDLLAIARSRGQQHLMAISVRSSISEDVTDVLVNRGDQNVVHSVASNQGANFSDSGYRALVNRSKDDARLQETVGLRKDIPPQHFRALVAQATDVVRRKLMTAGAGGEKLNKVLGEVAQDVAQEAGAAQRNYGAALQSITTLRGKGRLNEADLQSFARSGKLEEVVCMLSAMVGVSIDVVDRLMFGDRVDPVLIMCKSINLNWSTVKAILQARPTLTGSSEMGLDECNVNFDRLSITTAQRVIRFWQVRETALKASA